ncbi:MAG: hypothetical protein DCC68_23505 [Planctomycetota bacterium]|nr:MAG: hypothetical protein DCC68_23505 [Planctomycetota bacterium]
MTVSTDYEVWRTLVFAQSDVHSVEQLDKCAVNGFATRFNREIASIVDAYGEEATAEAIEYLYGDASGQVYWCVLDESLGSLRVDFIRSIKSLYTDCFLPRCSRYYSHIDQGPEALRPLNGVCYMLWDLGVECPALNGDLEMLDASLDVLSFALALPSVACQESALHGLGHLAYKHNERTMPIVEEYLKRDDLPIELRNYAQAARVGYVL